MKYRLILNPSSRSGRGQKQWELWHRSLRETGVDYESLVTKKAGDAFHFARGTQGECTVVAVGGDGTINEVLDGIMQSGNPELRMGVLYAGTSPDFCRFHHIPVDFQEALDALLKGNTTRVDVCRIRYRDREGTELTAHFGCSSNIGMGASVARYANRIRRYLGDSIGTGAAVLKTVFSCRPPDLDLVVDTEQVSLTQVNNLSVIKNPYLASGLKLDLDISPDDGNMWVMGLCGKDRLRMTWLLPRCYTGSIVHVPGVYLKKVRTVRIASPNPCEVEFDGDPRGCLPVKIEMLYRALQLTGAFYERE